MRADVTNLDWAAPPEPSVLIKEKPCPDSRQAGRVSVSLQVAIGTLNRGYLTKSVDMSETGVLINGYGGSLLNSGTTVRVLIRGIISDDDADEQFLSMYVVRCEGSQMALSFGRQ